MPKHFDEYWYKCLLYIKHSLKFNHFSQFDILVALKPQWLSGHIRTWRIRSIGNGLMLKSLKSCFWNAGILQGPSNFKSWISGLFLKLTFQACHPPMVSLVILRKTFVYRVKTLGLTVSGHEGVKWLRGYIIVFSNGSECDCHEIHCLVGSLFVSFHWNDCKVLIILH